MSAEKMTPEQFQRLVDDISAKMHSRRSLVLEAGGHVTIDVYPTKSNFDVKLTFHRI